MDSLRNPVSVSAMTGKVKKMIYETNLKILGTICCIPIVSNGIKYLREGNIDLGDLTVGLAVSVVAGMLVSNLSSKKNKEEKESKKEKEDDSDSLIYRLLFENSVFPMMIINSDTGEIIEANSASIKKYGYSHLKGQNMSCINTLGMSTLDEIKKIKIGGTYRFQHKLNNGELCDVEVYISRLCIGGRDLLFTIIKDITEDVKLKKEFGILTSLFETVIQNHPDDWVIFDVDTHRIRYSKDNSLLREDERLCFCKYYLNLNTECIMREVLENGEYKKEIADEKNDLYKKIIAYPIPDNDGNTRCVVVSITDIKERKVAELKLKRALQASELLINAIPHPAFLIDSNKRILVGNKAGNEVRLNNSEICYMALHDGKFVNNVDREHLEISEGLYCNFCKAQDAMNSGTMQTMDIKLNDRHRKVVWIPVSDDIYLHYLMDITENKEQQIELEDKITLLKLYFARLTHDIKNALGGVTGFASIIENNVTDSEQDIRFQNKYLDSVIGDPQKTREYVDLLLEYIKSFNGDIYTMRFSVESLKILIFNILAQIDYEKSGVKLKFDKFSFPQFAEECKKTFSHISKIQSFEFDVNIDENIPEYMIGDSFAMMRIVMNLLNNAFKYTNYGKVGLYFELDKVIEDSIYINIRVVDNGNGIDSENLKRIFEDFYQGDKSTGMRDGGAGLGLSIVNELTKALNGEISVKTGEGKGTEFKINIPLKRVIEQ